MNAEQEALIARLIARDAQRTEADVQSDVRQLLLTSDLNLDGEKLEVLLEPQVGGGRRIDIEVGATVIEIKKDLRIGHVRPNGVDQLRGYVESRQRERGGRYVGVLTDGAEWACFHLQGGKLVEASKLEVSSAKKDGARLVTWLEGVLATTRHVRPTPDAIRQRVGAGSSAHALDSSELAALYAASKERPEVRTKRHLWARLLTAALGTQFDDNDELFVEHTLLVNSAEIIAHALLDFDVGQLNPRTLLSGGQFDQSEIYGVVEADFFDWVLDVQGGEAFIGTLARRLGRFDWGSVEHDVLKVLYESIIAAETRKKMGEYYTPDWLAQRVVDEVVTYPLEQRVLDPACGSGTFLFHAVRRYLAAAEASGLSTRDAVEGVTSRVLGMDLHPVAVTLARVTYLLAIGRERLSSDRGPIHIPVYLGDSIQWRQPAPDLLTRSELVIDTEVERTLLGGVPQQRLALEAADQFHFAASVLTNFSRFDGLIKALSKKAFGRTKKGHPYPPLKNEFAHYVVPQDAQESVTESFHTMCRLHDEGRDHIWGYYIRNFARPQWLIRPENRVDVLVGNPPWLAYRHMPAGMQKRFVQMSTARHLWHGAKHATNQDLSALFAVRAIEIYLKPEGSFGFVMPSAALQSGQFKGFRSGLYDGSSGELRVAFSEGWDLRKIRPHFFPISCSVVLGKLSSSSIALRSTAVWSGRLPEDHAHGTWDAVATALKIEDAAPKQARVTPISEYAARFRQGATIVPRALFFVERLAAGPLGLSSGRARVRTTRSANEKKPWKDVPRLEGVVESEFLRPVHMGETVLPFRPLEPLLAVVPRDTEGLLGGESERLDQYPGLATWWREAERCWMEHRSSERLSLVQRLDYVRGLGAQFPIQDRRVVYSASGMHISAAQIVDRRVLVEHNLYWATVASEEEATYLCTILNAVVTTIRVRPLMSYGKDERHIDKYVWQLPIPTYDASKPEHVALAKLGKQAEGLVAGLPLNLKTHFAANRRAIREALAKSEVGKAIEEQVSALLDAPGEAGAARAVRATGLLTELRRLVARGAEQDAINLVIAQVDDWCLEGQFEEVDALLRELDPAQMPPAVALAVLSAVQPAREKLQERQAFVARAAKGLGEALGAERANRLMVAWR